MMGWLGEARARCALPAPLWKPLLSQRLSLIMDTSGGLLATVRLLIVRPECDANLNVIFLNLTLSKFRVLSAIGPFQIAAPFAVTNHVCQNGGWASARNHS